MYLEKLLIFHCDKNNKQIVFLQFFKQ